MSETPVPAAYAHNGRPVSAEAFYAIACDPRRHVAVEACAGAGKTWMLVSRIVRALLDGTDAADGRLQVMPHEILAITFTKRAASEMRERLLRWMREFAHAPDAVLVKELHDRGVRSAPGSAAAQADVQRLSGLYRKVLRHGRPVQVRTFHSWFAALLRAAPLAVLQQLELPLSYELLEDDEEALRLVWRRFYQTLLEQPGYKADFEAVVLQHGRAQTERALSGALDKRIEFTLADRAGVVEQSVKHFGLLFPVLADLQAPCAALASDAARKRWLAWAKALAQESNKTPRKAAQLIAEAFACAEPAGASDLASRLVALRQALFVADEDRLTHHLQRYPAAQEAQAELALLCAAAHQHETWLYQQRMARLGRVLIAEYAALKRARGWVDMTDVERSALVLLSDPVLSGWVLERLDTRVKHLLIDEFQDTNPLQWQALLSWLGSYAGARGKAPSVFIVGDPKQSIYRFRRAEPQVFIAAQDFLARGLGGDLLSCDHTRRNATQVIATVNAVMLSAQHTDAYDGFREHTTSRAETGLVGVLPPIPRLQAKTILGSIDLQEDTGGGEPWRDSLTTPRTLPEETLRNLEARQAAQWIAQQVQAGLAPQDVMVLSRRRAGLLPLQQALRALGIPAQIGEKTGLIECCEVQDIVALLDVLVSNQHDLSLARALKSPLFGIADQALVALALRCRADRQPWFSLLQQEWPVASGLQGVGSTLVRWKAWLAGLPPHDALQAIYTDQDVLARFATAAPTTQRDAVLANLRALLVAALQLGGGRYATPYAFVRVLKAGGVLAPPTVDEAAVRLLTIHGAKGLEAQAVVLLDTDTPERPAETMGVLVDWPGHAAQPRKFVFMASEKYPPACAVQTLEAERAGRRREELNALYVALTRARHTLVVSSITPHREAPGSWWQRLSGLIAHQVTVPSIPTTDTIRNGSAGFHLKVLPMAPVTPPPNTVSGQDAGYASPTPPDEDSAVARLGKAMHRLLEWGDTSRANAAAAAAEFGLDADQGIQAAAMAGRILQGQGAWVWDNTLLAWQANEVELMYQGEPLRLDRLVQRKDTGQWWVLDFKSSPAPQYQPALMAQLQAYRSAVQEITPGAVVRAAFLTGQGDLIELPPAPG